MEFKDALKQGLYDFEAARNWYRIVCNPDNGGPGMHHDLVFAWIRSNALMVAPFTPHFSEYIWQKIIGESTTVQNAPFPTASGPVDRVVIQQLDYMRGVVDTMRSAEALLNKKKGKGKGSSTYDPSKPKYARIFVAKLFPEWQSQCVEAVKSAWDPASNTVDDGKMRQGIEAAGLGKDKKAMPFCSSFKVRSFPTYRD